MKKPNIAPGDVVTCKIAVEAYYSNYGGNPKMVFKPGMIGTVANIVPKVRIVPGDGKDGHPRGVSAAD